MFKINNSVHYINPSTLSRNKYTGAEHVNKLKKRFSGNSELQNLVLHRFFLVWFDSLRQLTAMVMLGWSVHLTTLFFCASLTKELTSTSCTYFRLQLTTTLLESREGRMTVEIISWSISTKVWDRVGIKLSNLDLQSTIQWFYIK